MKANPLLTLTSIGILSACGLLACSDDGNSDAMSGVVEALQQELTTQGYNANGHSGARFIRNKGRFDLITEQALMNFEADNNLTADGVFDHRVSELLEEPGQSSVISNLQMLLIDYGYSNVSVNGHYDAETTHALRDLQRRVGVSPTGVLSVSNIAEINRVCTPEPQMCHAVDGGLLDGMIHLRYGTFMRLQELELSSVTCEMSSDTDLMITATFEDDAAGSLKIEVNTVGEYGTLVETGAELLRSDLERFELNDRGVFMTYGDLYTLNEIGFPSKYEFHLVGNCGENGVVIQ